MKPIFYFILLPALLPVFALLYYVYSKDKVEREPLTVLIRVFALGGLFSLLDIPAESFANRLIVQYTGSASGMTFDLYSNFLGIALVEELTKWLVLMVYIWKIRDFDYRYDGIVYAVAASLGFAGLENILYVLRFGTSVSIGRALFSIPGHTAFAVFMGFFLARAKHWDLRGSKILCGLFLLLSVAVPVCIHGIYDFLLSPSGQASPVSFILFVILLDALAWLFIRHEFRTDRPLGQ